MKIIYIHDELINSGKANVIQVVHMCKAFCENNIRVVLALPLDKKSKLPVLREIERIFNEEVEFEIITYNKITILGRLRFVGGLLGAWKIFRKYDADIYYLRNVAYLCLAVYNKLPSVYEAHQLTLHNANKLLNKFWEKMLVRMARSEYLTKFVAISKALSQAWIEKGVPRNKVVALHDGCDVNIREINCDKNEYKAKLNIPHDRKIVLYTGSIYKNRCIENILSLSKIFYDELFVVVGGPVKNKIFYENLSDRMQLKNIIFTGPVPHHAVRKYLYISDVLLMIWSRQVNTINYCSPLKMFEYMAAGRIIVGHAFPTIKEVLEHGVTAYLADPDSFLDLKNNLSVALRQKYPNKMADCAQELAIKHYSWNKRAKKIKNSIRLHDINIKH